MDASTASLAAPGSFGIDTFGAEAAEHSGRRGELWASRRLCRGHSRLAAAHLPAGLPDVGEMAAAHVLGCVCDAVFVLTILDGWTEKLRAGGDQPDQLYSC